MDASSLCYFADARDHRSGGAGSGHYRRNRAFVASGAFKVVTALCLTERLSLLHDDSRHHKSVNRIAPPQPFQSISIGVVRKSL